MITEERKAQLQALGYTVDNMQEAWGDGWWNGQFRWTQNGDEDFGSPQSSEAQAWVDCDKYQRQLYLLQEVA